MCQHNSFIIIKFIQGVTIRKCKDCGEIEIITEDWIKQSILTVMISIVSITEETATGKYSEK